MCNVIIQPHIDYTCSTWYPNLTQKLKTLFKPSVFAFVFNWSTISHKEFKDLNLLPAITSFEQCIISIMFKFINGSCLYYLHEVFEFAPKGNVSLRNNFLKLKQLFRNTNSGQKALSFIGPSFCNPRDIKENRYLKYF